MTIDENTRLDLRQWFESNMGERLARAMMELMPPIDYAALATKEDVAMLGRELRAEFRREISGMGGEITGVRGEISGVRGEIAELRGEVRSEISGVRGEVAEFRGEVRSEISGVRGEVAEFRGEVHLEIAKQTRLLVTMQVMTFGATIAAMVGLATVVAA